MKRLVILVILCQDILVTSGDWINCTTLARYHYVDEGSGKCFESSDGETGEWAEGFDKCAEKGAEYGSVYTQQEADGIADNINEKLPLKPKLYLAAKGNCSSATNRKEYYYVNKDGTKRGKVPEALWESTEPSRADSNYGSIKRKLTGLKKNDPSSKPFLCETLANCRRVNQIIVKNGRLGMVNGTLRFGENPITCREGYEYKFPTPICSKDTGEWKNLPEKIECVKITVTVPENTRVPPENPVRPNTEVTTQNSSTCTNVPKKPKNETTYGIGDTLTPYWPLVGNSTFISMGHWTFAATRHLRPFP